MRKESLVTLTRSEFDAYQARQLAWWIAAHPEKKTRAKNTRKAPAKNTPREVRAPRENTPTTAANVDARMAELRERYGLGWDDDDLAVATTPDAE